MPFIIQISSYYTYLACNINIFIKIMKTKFAARIFKAAWEWDFGDVIIYL